MATKGKALLTQDNTAFMPEEDAIHQSIIDSSDMLLQLRKDVDRRKQELSIVFDEKNNQIVENYNKKIDILNNVLFDPDVVEKVKGNIKTAFDYNMYVKALSALYNMAMAQQTKSADITKANAGKGTAKINVLYGNGVTAISVKTNGGE